MEKRGFGYAEFGLGLVLGMLAGSMVALIFAPQSGRVTRRQIADKASDLRGSAEEMIEHAKKNIEEASSRMEGVLGLQEKSVRRKIEELRTELERLNLGEARG